MALKSFETSIITDLMTQSHSKRPITSNFEMSDKFMDVTRKVLPQELFPLKGNVKAPRNM